MQFTDNRNITRWIIIAASFLIVLSILWNTYKFFNIFKDDERTKVELWAMALNKLNSSDLDADIELPSAIIERNQNVPMIITNSRDSILNTANLPEGIENDTLKVRQFLENIKKENAPIQ